MSRSRARLIATATALFYERGIAATGVDLIAARSGVSKPTLYSHFATKHLLVVEVLAQQHAERRQSLADHLRNREGLTAGERLLSVFDWIEGHQRGDWARGCPFVNMSVELGAVDDPGARSVTAHHKQWFRKQLHDLAARAGAENAARLASQLHLLIEGANARMLAESDLGAISHARQAAAMMLAAATKGAEQ